MALSMKASRISLAKTGASEGEGSLFALWARITRWRPEQEGLVKLLGSRCRALELCAPHSARAPLYLLLPWPRFRPPLSLSPRSPHPPHTAAKSAKPVVRGELLFSVSGGLQLTAQDGLDHRHRARVMARPLSVLSPPRALCSKKQPRPRIAPHAHQQAPSRCRPARSRRSPRRPRPSPRRSRRLSRRAPRSRW